MGINVSRSAGYPHYFARGNQIISMSDGTRYATGGEGKSRIAGPQNAPAIREHVLNEAQNKLNAEWGNRPIPPSVQAAERERAEREAARRINNAGGSFRVY